MRLKERYKKEIIPELKKKLNKQNILDLSRLEKVVINVGFGKDHKDSKFIDFVEENLKKICGQLPVRTKAKKSISNFKLREGSVIGLKVTLRNEKMYDFIDKLIAINLPRVKDFRGIDIKSVDNKGNITIGFKEQVVFPEIKAEGIEKLHGLEVTISVKSNTREEAIELYRLMGIPFKKDNKK